MHAQQWEPEWWQGPDEAKGECVQHWWPAVSTCVGRGGGAGSRVYSQL